MSELISMRAYAHSRRERGLPGGSLAAVQKAVASQRIRLIEGKVDPDVADIQWARNTDPDQQKRGAGLLSEQPTAQSASVVEPAVQASVPEPRPPQPTDQVSRIREAARADAARAELLEYELELKRGTLVRAVDVRKATLEKARIARDALLAIPDRLAPQLAVESDPAKIHAVLVQELRRVCGELATGEVSPTRQ